MASAFESALLIFITGAIAFVVIALVKRDLDAARRSRSPGPVSKPPTPLP